MLSAQQHQVLASRSTGMAVSACPGSGKTRTLVELFIQISRNLQPTHGAAVLSFTNVAAEEVRKRCHQVALPQLPRFPNFVGSLDSFIFRYAVMPFGSRWHSGSRLVLIESWSRIDRGVSVGGPPVSLDYFIFDELEGSQINWNSLPRELHAVAQKDPTKLCRAAYARRLVWLRRGYLSCADARLLAKMNIEDPSRASELRRMVGARFKHVLVDEAQDCNKLDAGFIGFLFRSGVNVALFYDPDQSIYEFRGTNSATLDGLVSSMPHSVRLSHNHRSTQNICDLASSLRAVAGQRDVAIGVRAREETPVYLVPYKGKISEAIGLSFSSLLRQHQIPLKDAVVLAHSHLNAFKAVGGVLEDGSRVSSVGRVADAVRKVHLGGNGRKLLESVQDISTLLLERMGIEDEQSVGEPERRLLRTQALRLVGLLAAKPVSCDPSWVEFVRSCFDAVTPLPSYCFRKTVKQLLVYNKSMTWPTSSVKSAVDIRASTVHQVKGQEFEAVALVLVKDGRQKSSIADWRNRVQGSEGRRVLYVGATRARRLLVLAVPHDLTAEVSDLCTRDGAKICVTTAF